MPYDALTRYDILILFRFLAVCPSAQNSHITAWINKNVPPSVQVQNVTSQYSVLGLMGPKSREILQHLTKTSLDNSKFPYGTSQVGYSFDKLYIILVYF